MLKTGHKLCTKACTFEQRWSRGHKARGQGHKKISRPRTDPLKAKTKDQGHIRKCSPKKKKKEKGLQKCFSGDLYLRKPKKGLCRFSSRLLAFFNKNLTVQNSAVLEPRTGQFYVSSRTSPRPRTSSRTPPLLWNIACVLSFVLCNLAIC